MRNEANGRYTGMHQGIEELFNAQDGIHGNGHGLSFCGLFPLLGSDGNCMNGLSSISTLSLFVSFFIPASSLLVSCTAYTFPLLTAGHCWNSLGFFLFTYLVGYGYLMFEWRLRRIVILSYCLLFFLSSLTCESALRGDFRNCCEYLWFSSPFLILLDLFLCLRLGLTICCTVTILGGEGFFLATSLFCFLICVGSYLLPSVVFFLL